MASDVRLEVGDEGVFEGNDKHRWRVVARLPNGHFALWIHDADNVMDGWLREVNHVRGSED